ncbi:hypothetical protein ACFQV2_18290 [Actinokineospora soli]|uniref:Uncharacterized protein n=1 Tax=Actinokineospora soli TaxID=1048753 RepID=A0ABW2TP72_9PSEU
MTANQAPWRSGEMWLAVAADLRQAREAGLGALLTAHTVRLSTARALVASGVDPAGLGTAFAEPRVGLVVGHPRPGVLLEFRCGDDPQRSAPEDGVERIVVSVEANRPYLAGSVDAVISLDDSLRLAVYWVAAGGAARNVRR